MKAKPSEALRRARNAKAWMRLAQVVAIAPFFLAVYSFYRRDYSLGWFWIILSVLSGLLLALPAVRAFRRLWQRLGLRVGYGKYAEQTELDEQPHMAPEQFELLCLFPFDDRGISDFEAHRELVGMQPGDVPVTYADSEALAQDYGFTPTIDIREGLRKFAEWYKEYYKA